MKYPFSFVQYLDNQLLLKVPTNGPLSILWSSSVYILCDVGTSHVSVDLSMPYVMLTICLVEVAVATHIISKGTFIRFMHDAFILCMMLLLQLYDMWCLCNNWSYTRMSLMHASPHFPQNKKISLRILTIEANFAKAFAN